MHMLITISCLKNTYRKHDAKKCVYIMLSMLWWLVIYTSPVVRQDDQSLIVSKINHSSYDTWHAAWHPTWRFTFGRDCMLNVEWHDWKHWEWQRQNHEVTFQTWESIDSKYTNTQNVPLPSLSILSLPLYLSCLYTYVMQNNIHIIHTNIHTCIHICIHNAKSLVDICICWYL